MTTSGPGNDQPEQGARDSSAARRRGHRGRRPRSVRGHRAARGNGGDLRGQRRAQGPLLRRGHGPAGHCRGLGTRNRRARWPARRRVRAIWRRRFELPGKVREALRDARRLRRPRQHRALCLRRRASRRRRSRFAARGTVEGRISPEPRGAHGFGYDPIFFYPPEGRTLAEVGDEVKRAVSHRGAAFRALRAWLEKRT